jgi:hypothetical protein
LIADQLTPRRLPTLSHRGGVALAAGAVLAAAAAAGLLTGSRPLFVAGLLAGAAAVSLALDWRRLVLAAAVLVLVEALFRRYAVNDVAVFFVKDAVLAVAYGKFALERLRMPEWPLRPTAFELAVLAFGAVVAVQALNPALPSPAVGLLGVHAWLWYVPIAWLVAHAFRTAADGLRFLRGFALLSVPIAVLAFAQMHVPALNRSYYFDLLGHTDFHSAGERWIPTRSIGTFASPGAYSDYLIAVALVAAALLFAVRSTRQAALVAGVLAAVVAGIGASASRSGAGALVVALATFLVLHRRPDRRLLLAGGAAVAVVAAFVLLTPLLPGLYRAGALGLGPESVQARLGDHFVAPIRDSVERSGARSLAGHGAGLAAGGAQYLGETVLDERQAAELEALAGPEGGWAAAFWELGLPGVAALAFLLAAAGALGLRAFRRAADPGSRSLAAVGVLMAAGTAVLMVPTSKLNHATYAVLFWFALGFTLLVSRLQRDARA